MPIGILERAGVATPEGIVRRIGDRRASLLHLGYHCVHLGLTPNVVPERKLSGASRSQWYFGFMGERCAGLNGKLQTMLKIEERDRAMFELPADDALRRETQSITIKFQRLFQIVNTESNPRDSWLHNRMSAPFLARRTGNLRQATVRIG